MHRRTVPAAIRKETADQATTLGPIYPWRRNFSVNSSTDFVVLPIEREAKATISQSGPKRKSLESCRRVTRNLPILVCRVKGPKEHICLEKHLQLGVCFDGTLAEAR